MLETTLETMMVVVVVPRSWSTLFCLTSAMLPEIMILWYLGGRSLAFVLLFKYTHEFFMIPWFIMWVLSSSIPRCKHQKEPVDFESPIFLTYCSWHLFLALLGSRLFGKTMQQVTSSKPQNFQWIAPHRGGWVGWGLFSSSLCQLTHVKITSSIVIVVGLMESTENAMVFTQPVSPDDLKLPGCAREKFAASSILGFGNFTSTHLGNRTQNFRRFSIRVFLWRILPDTWPRQNIWKNSVGSFWWIGIIVSYPRLDVHHHWNCLERKK